MHKKTVLASISLMVLVGTFTAQRLVKDQGVEIGLHDIGRVESVIDGGTLAISYSDGKTPFTGRLANVGAPALTDPAGPQAQQSLEQLVSGRTIAFTIDSYDKDGTPRLAIEVDGLDIATEQLRHGWVRLQGPAGRDLVAAESAARSEHLGIWSLTMASN